MPIRGIVSTLSDQKYVAALEKELEELRADVEALKGYIKNVGRGN